MMPIAENQAENVLLDQADAQPIEEPAAPDRSVTSLAAAPILEALRSGPKPDIMIALDTQNAGWTRRLADEIAALPKDDGLLSFRLTPRHLGSLDIGVVETSQGLLIELKASTEDAARIVAREEPKLIDELRHRGVAVADCTFHFGASGDSRQHRNGPIPATCLPSDTADQQAIEEQQVKPRAADGRFA